MGNKDTMFLIMSSPNAFKDGFKRLRLVGETECTTKYGVHNAKQEYLN